MSQDYFFARLSGHVIIIAAGILILTISMFTSVFELLGGLLISFMFFFFAYYLWKTDDDQSEETE